MARRSTGDGDHDVEVHWEEPTDEAEWRQADAPPEGHTLEAAARAALADERGAVSVTFRRDGQRWRVQATAQGGAVETLRLTRKVVEAVRQTGHQAEPGFPADLTQPELPVNPVE
jgi:autotransporter translocation and assembly factor TamB